MHTRNKWRCVLVVPLVATLVFTACAPAAAPPKATATTAPATAPTTPAKAAAPSPEAKAAAPTSVPAKPKEPLKLKVAAPHPGSPDMGVAAIADAMGYFKNEGLTVEFVFTQGGGDTVQAVQVANGADIGLQVGPMSVLGAVEKGADLVIISAANTPADQRWITTKDSPYKTIKDLAGKPVGYTSAGSSTNLFLLGILEKEGIKAELVAAGAMGGNMWTQVKTGQIAAGPSQPPDVWERMEAEGARQLFAVKDYPEFLAYTFGVNFARGETVKNKAEAIKAFFKGWKKAAELMVKDPVAATKAYMPNTQLTEALTLRFYKEMHPTLFNLKPIGGMDISIKYAKQFKFITKDPDLNKVVNLSLVPD